MSLQLICIGTLRAILEFPIPSLGQILSNFLFMQEILINIVKSQQGLVNYK